MDLNKLFEIQAKLDERIMQEHNLQGQDLLDKKILSLQVELGECANEWRGFKFWSKDQEPRTQGLNPLRNFNPLLEEYVDVLHFILSIGIELNTQDISVGDYLNIKTTTVTDQFNKVFEKAVDLKHAHKLESKGEIRFIYAWLIKRFHILGEMLGFTWEQIEQAYMDKNAINHTRQDTGY